MTMYDNQTKIHYMIYEGERKMVADNNFLGEFELTNLTPAPRGRTGVQLTFELDENGILEVTATEIGKNNTKSLVIDRKNSSLSKADVDRMLADARRSEDVDQMHAERTAVIREFDNFISKHERALADPNQSVHISISKRKKAKTMCSEELKWLRENVGECKDVIQARQRSLEAFFNHLNFHI